MNYKETVKDLIEYFNNLAEDPIRKLKGKFRIEVINRSTVSNEGTEDSIKISLMYDDIDTLPIIKTEYILSNTKNGYISSEEDAYKAFYRTIINYMLFVKDSVQSFEDSYGRPLVVKRIDTLLKEGYKED
jgi:hypothetical protein